MRKLRPVDIEALKVMEGNIPYVYDDSVYPTRKHKRGAPVGGTLTAGVGHTGSDVLDWIGKDIPDATINRWLETDIAPCCQWAQSMGGNLNDNQFAAVSFWSFNVGLTAAKRSTLAKKLIARDYDAVPAELRKWTKTRVNGKMITSNGLIKRRADEIAYWLADPNHSAPKPVPRPNDKPAGTQAASPEVPKTLTLENVSTAGGIVSMVFGSVSNGPLAYALAGIAFIAFCIAAYWFITKRMFPR